tara:strand:+ start:7021 stop:11181 length:4161 start_codon:yes stop_codon:yes gene_type:complete
MAIKVYKGSARSGNIGVNVAGANTVANALDRQASAFNSFAQSMNARASKIARSEGIEAAQSETLSKILTINPDTGNPEAYAPDRGFGRIFSEAKNQILDQRYEIGLTDDLKRKQIELVKKYSYDPANFTESFASYYTGKVNGANPKFKNMANELGEKLSFAGNASINANIEAREKAEAQKTLAIKSQDHIMSARSLGGNGGSVEQWKKLSINFDKTIQPFIESGLVTEESIRAFEEASEQSYLSGVLYHYITTDLQDANDLTKIEINTFLSHTIRFGSNSNMIPDNAPNKKKLEEIIKAINSAPRTTESIDIFGKMSESAFALSQKQKEIAQLEAEEQATAILTGVGTVDEQIEQLKKLKDQNQNASQDQIYANHLKKLNEIKAKQSRDNLQDDASNRLDYLSGYRPEEKIEGSSKSIEQQLTQIGKNAELSKDPTAQKKRGIKTWEAAIKIMFGNIEQGLQNTYWALKEKAEKAGISDEKVKEEMTRLSTYLTMFTNENLNPQLIDQIDKQENVPPVIKEWMKEIINLATSPDVRNALDHNILAIGDTVKFNGMKKYELWKTDYEKRQAEYNKKQTIGRKRFVSDQIIYNEGLYANPTSVTSAINHTDYLISLVREMESREEYTSAKSNEIQNDLLATKKSFIYMKVMEETIGSRPTLESLTQIKNFLQTGSLTQIEDSPFKDLFSSLVNDLGLPGGKEALNKMISIAIAEQKEAKEKFEDNIKKHDHMNGTYTGENKVGKWYTPDGEPPNYYDFFSDPSLLNNETFMRMARHGNIDESLKGVIDSFLANEWHLFGNSDPRQFLKNLDMLINYQDPNRTSPEHNIIPVSIMEKGNLKEIIHILNFVNGSADLESSKAVFIEAMNARQVRIDEGFDERRKNIFPQEGMSSPKAGTSSAARTLIAKTLGLDRTDVEMISMYEDLLDTGIEFYIDSKEQAVNFLKNTHEKIYPVTETVWDNPNSTSQENANSNALKKVIADKNTLTAVMSDHLMSDIYPALIDHMETSIILDSDLTPEQKESLRLESIGQLNQRPIKIDGYKAVMPTGVDATGQINTFVPTKESEGIVRIRLVPVNNYAEDPLMVIDDDDIAPGYQYYALRPNQTQYTVWFNEGGQNTDGVFIPILTRSRLVNLDAITKHHYTNIAEGKAIVNEDGSLSTIRNVTVGLSFGEGSPEYTFILPTIFDGKEYPVNSEEDINALIQRISQDYAIADFPHFPTEEEANIAYYNIKKNWEAIGNDGSKAQEILNNYNTTERNVLIIDPAEHANKYYRQDAVANFERMDFGVAEAEAKRQRAIANFMFHQSLNQPSFPFEEITITPKQIFQGNAINGVPIGPPVEDITKQSSQYWTDFFQSNINPDFSAVEDAFTASPGFRKRMGEFFYPFRDN